MDRERELQIMPYATAPVKMLIADACIGGGGGNRTRVRKYYSHASTCVVSLFQLRTPVRRLTGFLDPYLP